MLSSMGQFRISCIQYTRCLHHPPRFSVYILYCIPSTNNTNQLPPTAQWNDRWLTAWRSSMAGIIQNYSQSCAPLWRELFRIILSPVLLDGGNYSELFAVLCSSMAWIIQNYSQPCGVQYILAHSDGSLCGTTAACEVTMTICERLEEVLSDQIRQIFSYLFLQCIIIIIIIKNIYNWH